MALLSAIAVTRAVVIKSLSHANLYANIRQNIMDGATVYTDDYKGYNGLHHGPYEHKYVKRSVGQFVNGKIYTNGVESVWALFKRSYVGTYHTISFKHPQKYLNEFSFRLNEGNVDRDTIDRMESLCECMNGKRLKYKDYVGGSKDT